MIYDYSPNNSFSSISIDGEIIDLNSTSGYGYNPFVCNNSFGFNSLDSEYGINIFATLILNDEYTTVSLGSFLETGEYVFDFINNKFYIDDVETELYYDAGATLLDLSKVIGVIVEG